MVHRHTQLGVREHWAVPLGHDPDDGQPIVFGAREVDGATEYP